jgi:uncharacterized protein
MIAIHQNPKGFLVASLFLLAASGCQRADMTSAQAVDAKGDYATAAKEYRVLAERGDSGAQYELSVRFDIGRGLPQDFAEGAKWLERSANAGNVAAQYSLALHYDQGIGVPIDYAKAYFWVRLADKGRFPGAHTFYESAVQKITVQQRADQDRLFNSWQPKTS